MRILLTSTYKLYVTPLPPPLPPEKTVTKQKINTRIHQMGISVL